MTWQVRSLRPGEAAKVAELYQETYRRPLDPAFYHWKLHLVQAQSGAANVWVAAEGNRLVGHYGGTPRRFWLQGQTVPARHTSDAMTSPQNRRQGVYSAVGTTAHQTWTAAGETFLFGLPNDKWGSRVAYLNYRRMFPAIWLRRPLHPAGMLAHRFNLPPLFFSPLSAVNRVFQAGWSRQLRQLADDNVTVAPVDRPGSEFDALWEAVKKQYEALVVRDCAWVTYRYINVPGCDYRLLFARRYGEPVGYLAYRLTSGETGVTGWIMDLFTAPNDEETRANLLLACLAVLSAARAGNVRILLPPGTPLYSLLRRAGFSVAAGSFGCHIVPLAWEDPLPVFYDPCRWFTMAGDYDII